MGRSLSGAALPSGALGRGAAVAPAPGSLGGGPSDEQLRVDSALLAFDVATSVSENDHIIGISFNASFFADLANLVSDIFGGDGSHAPTFRLSHYKRPHNPECGFIGVYGGSCATEAPPNPPPTACPCPPVPQAPPGVSVNDNIRKIESIDNIVTFIALESPYGDWDYKRKGYKYDAFGNFNYGAARAACGVPDYLLVNASGVDQLTVGTMYQAQVFRSLGGPTTVQARPMKSGLVNNMGI